MFKDQHIWIIGASSGIGAALAKELAGQGAILTLSARRKEQLEKLKQELGPVHHVYPLDVTNAADVEKAAMDIAQNNGKIDRAIFMAAIYNPTSIKRLDMALTKQLLEVNLLGAIHVTHALLPVFDDQQSGQIALCASVAGYTGLPGGQPYSASKAGLINFAESLKAEAPDYLDVKLINPGFVRTPMTAKNKFHMPMCIEVDAAAKLIAKGLGKRKFEIHFPKTFTYLVKMVSILPHRLKFLVLRQML